MSFNREQVLKIKTRSADQFLRELVGLTAATPEGRGWPIIRVHFVGTVHMGTPVRIERVGQQDWLTLFMESRHESPFVTFIPLSSVLSVSLVDADRHVDYLVSGQVLSVDASQAPTKLELGRRLSLVAHGSTKFAWSWNNLESDDKTRAAAAMLVEVLPRTLSEIAADDMGRSALASLTLISLAAAPAPAELRAQLTGTELHIHFSSQLPLKDLAASLKSAVESAL